MCKRRHGDLQKSKRDSLYFEPEPLHKPGDTYSVVSPSSNRTENFETTAAGIERQHDCPSSNSLILRSSSQRSPTTHRRPGLPDRLPRTSRSHFPSKSDDTTKFMDGERGPSPQSPKYVVPFSWGPVAPGVIWASSLRFILQHKL